MKIILGAAIAASLVALTAVPASAIESSIKGSSTASADAVWAKIGDFCGIGKWHPAIEKCVLSADGKQRTLSLKGGGTVVEKLVLDRYMRKLLETRIRILKELAEGSDWSRFV